MSTPPPYPGALPPPPGVVPNVTDPDVALRRTYLIAVAILAAFPVVLVPLRLYIRGWITKKFTKVDYTLILASLAYIAAIVIAFDLANHGLGVHAWDVLPSVFFDFIRVCNLNQIFYCISIATAKCALLFQLEEIFVVQARNSRWWILNGLVIVNIMFYIAALCLTVFECVPREAIWNPNIKGRCLDIEKTYIVTAAINVLEDCLIIIFPICWVWQIKANLKKRLVVCLVFATGLIACASSVVRVVQSVLKYGTHDLTYDLVSIAIWAQAEVSLSIVVCCLPTLSRLFKKRKGTSSSSKTPAFQGNSLPRLRKDYYEMNDATASGVVCVPKGAQAQDEELDVHGYPEDTKSDEHATQNYSKPVRQPDLEDRRYSIDKA